MRYRHLGRSGLRVSELAMGTQTFGWGVDEHTAHRMADVFADSGGNFFDTSSSYNAGASESMLGSWLRSRRKRDAVVVATKVFFPTGLGPNDLGLSRKHILQCAEDSLRRLGTDYIDLYQAHCYDLATPIEETLGAFHDLVRAGKVRYLGVSNFTASQLMKAILTARSLFGIGLVSLQAEYSLLVRESEWELLPLCREEGLGMLAWSPLAGGWLSGKYVKGRPPAPESRAGRGDRWDDRAEQRESDLAWHVIERLRDIAARRGKTPAQVALNYLLSGSDLVVPTFGARTPDQLAENLGSAGWKLEAQDLQALSEASAIPLPYPYRFIERYTRRRNDDGQP